MRYPYMKEKMPYHLMIFEPDWVGHQLYYLGLVYRFVAEQNIPIKVTFLVQSEIPEAVLRYEGVEMRERPGSIAIVKFRSSEVEAMTTGPLPPRAFARWRYLKAYAIGMAADEVYCMMLDYLEPLIAIGFAKSSAFKLSGLLFHSIGDNNERASAFVHLKCFKEKQIFRSMLRRKLTGRVHTLVSYVPGRVKSWGYRGAEKVAFLPDVLPVDYVNGLTLSGASKRIQDSEISILSVGVFTQRKGLLETIRSLSFLAERNALRITLRIAGKIRDDIRGQAYREIDNYRLNGGKVRIMIEDRFLGRREMLDLIGQADIVLLAYQKHSGSSLIQLWAAAARKPTVVNQYGYIGYLARRYGLGITVRAEKPEEIARGIMFILDNDGIFPDIAGAEEFVSHRRHERFAQAFFSDFTTGG